MNKIIIVLLVCFFIVSCGVVVRGVKNLAESTPSVDLSRQGRGGKLSKQEQLWAKIAWKYFEENYHPETGLVNSKNGSLHASVWEMGDTIAATIAAKELGLIDKVQFDRRISNLLHFLNRMELFFGKMPNRYYHAEQGFKSNDEGKKEDVGWSAVDVGRLLIWLRILGDYDPFYNEYIGKAILRWNFCQVISDCGALYKGIKEKEKVSGNYQAGNEPELRSGYTEYSANGYAVWGFYTNPIYQVPYTSSTYIYGIEIPFDSSDARVTKHPSPIVSLPYILHGLEFNWDKVDDISTADTFHSDKRMAEMADKIYRVQEARYMQDKILTARTDHPIREKPYLLYDSIFAAGFPWNTLNSVGDKAKYLNSALVSTRAVFGLWVLWQTDYTDRLMAAVNTLYDAQEGWYEGRYERGAAHDKTVSCTTNAVILETLYYKEQGKLYHVPHQPDYLTYLDVVLKDEFRRPRACFPQSREVCKQPGRPR